MSEITYSVDALNALRAFHRVDFVVYVEGDDDVVFLDTVFSEFSGQEFEFLPTWSCTELDKRITQIESGELQAIAARDADYLTLTGRKSDSPRVIYTYGHSIENTIHHVESMHRIVKVSCRKSTSFQPQCERWLNEFGRVFFPLLKLELANEIEGGGIQVLGDNCTKFMLNETSGTPSTVKIDAHFRKVKESLREESILAAASIVEHERFDPIRWLRGHFVASGVQKFISNKSKDTGRKGSLPHESLFSQAVLCLISALKKNTDSYDHYSVQINRALGA